MNDGVERLVDQTRLMLRGWKNQKRGERNIICAEEQR